MRRLANIVTFANIVNMNVVFVFLSNLLMPANQTVEAWFYSSHLSVMKCLTMYFS